jgi:hypothetical protein
MIEQIRRLQMATPFEPFAIELTSGRVIQIYVPWNIATEEGAGGACEGLIGILHDDGFELINAAKIVAVSAGVHPVEAERFKKIKERLT